MASFHEENAEQLLLIAKFEQAPEIKRMFNAYGEKATIKKLYELVDGVLKKSGIFEKASCNKGCSFCCHDPIHLSRYEFALISEFIEINKIKIDKAYLKKQKSQDFDKLKWVDRKCVFLDKNNNCSIYPVRPLVCRTHNSLDEPKYCNRDKYNKPTTEGRILEVEAIFIALELLANNMALKGNMPMLNQYLKL